MNCTELLRPSYLLNFLALNWDGLAIQAISTRTEKSSRKKFTTKSVELDKTEATENFLNFYNITKLGFKALLFTCVSFLKSPPFVDKKWSRFANTKALFSRQNKRLSNFP